MSEDDGGGNGSQEKTKEDRQQRKQIVQLLSRKQIVEGQVLTFNYKRNTFECSVKEDGKLLYNDEDFQTEHTFFSLNAFANWCILHKCDSTNRSRGRNTDAPFFSYSHFYIDGRRLSDIINGVGPESPGASARDDAAASKRRQPDRKEKQAERSAKTRSERRDRTLEEKKDAILEEEDLLIGSRRRNTRLASGSIKHVDYKMSVQGSVSKQEGESDDESVGREAAATSTGRNQQGSRRDSDKDVSVNDSAVEELHKSTRRTRPSRLRRGTKGRTEADAKEEQQQENADEDEDDAMETDGNDEAKEEDEEEPIVQQEEEDVEVKEIKAELQDDAGLMDLDDDGGDSEEQSDGKEETESPEFRLTGKKAVLRGVRESQSLDHDAIFKAAKPESKSELTLEEVKSILDDIYAQMETVDLVKNGAKPSITEVIAFLASEVYQSEKQSQENSLKRSKSEQDMEKDTGRLRHELEAARSERREMEIMKEKRKIQLEEIKTRIDFEVKRRKFFEKERAALENQVREAREDAENEAKRRQDLELEKDALQLRELEARRRLDRAKLKVVALRGDLTAETLDAAVAKGASIMYNSPCSDDEESDLDTLLIKRKDLEKIVNRKENESVRWLRRVEFQRRKNHQLFETKNRRENDLYALLPKKPQTYHSVGKSAGGSKQDKKSKGSKEDVKKDKSGGKTGSNADNSKEAEGGRKKGTVKSAPATAEKAQNHAPGNTKTEAPQFVESKRKAKPMHSLA